MSVAQRRVGGVLGGMGPLATVDFLRKVIALTPAVRDQDHVPLIVHQVPQIPDRSHSIMAHDDKPLAPMLAGIARLARAGAEFVVIPCNTAHHWYAQLTAAQPLEIVHIADAVWDELQDRGWESRQLAVLATRGTLQSGFYKSRLEQRGAQFAADDESVQRSVDLAIRAVKEGQMEAARIAAREAGEQCLEAGAEVLILGCTELPIAFDDSALLQFCLDSTLALARHAVAYSRRG